MKRFKSLLFTILVAVFTVTMFTACGTSSIEFTLKTETIVAGQEYDPYSLIKEKINDSDKEKITFKIDNTEIACITPDNKIVSTGSGTIILFAYYNEKEVCKTELNVEGPKIQLNTPINIHYDGNGKLVWDYSFIQGEGDIYTANSYTVQIIRNNGTPYTEVVEFANELALTDGGSYKIKIKANGVGNYLESSYSENYTTFNIMSTPINLDYDNSTSVLSWEANGNAQGTVYSVRYAFNGETERILTTENTNITLPTIQQGIHSVYVAVEPQTENWFGNQSEVLTLQKLGTPTISFNNGNVNWLSVSNASEYLLTYKIGTTVKSENINGLSYTFDDSITAGDYTLTVTAISKTKNIFSGIPATYNFKKLPPAYISFNATTQIFTVSNANSEKYKLTLTNSTTLTSIVLDTESYKWNIDNYNTYTVKAQILAGNDFSTKIDGQIVENYNYQSQKLTKIKNLQSPELRYFENNNNSFIDFSEIDDAKYAVYINNSNQNLTINESLTQFALGNTQAKFATVGTYSIEMKITKSPAESTYYVNASSFVDVQKLSAPNLLGFVADSNVVNVKDANINANVVDIVYTINNQPTETNEIDTSLSSWVITAQFIARTDSNKINNINVYYTSSDVSTFTLQRLATPTNFVYNYQEKKFTYNAVDNVGTYRLYKNDNLLYSLPKSTLSYSYNQPGNYVVDLIAYPTNWASISKNTTAYYQSTPTSCTIYQSQSVSNLKLNKESDGKITALWTAPANTNFSQTIQYRVLVNDEEVVTGLTQEQYTFESDKFTVENGYEYNITVGIVSPSLDFFTPSINKSVQLNILENPTSLNKSGNNLTIPNIDLVKIQKIMVNNEESTSNIAISLNNGESKTYSIYFVGVFDDEKNIYYLDSEVSTFTLTKLQKVQNLDLNIVKQDTTEDYNFSWESQDLAVIGSDIKFAYYSMINTRKDVSETTELTNVTISKELNYNTEFIFFVKEIYSDRTWTSISNGETKYIDCDEYTEFVVKKDNQIQDFAMNLDEDNVILTWTYEKLDLQYTPEFLLDYKDADSIITNLVLNPDIYKISSIENISTFSYSCDRTLFEQEGSYSFTLTVKSSKTLLSPSNVLTITKLDSVKNIFVNGITAFLVRNELNSPLILNGVNEILLKINGETEPISENNTFSLAGLTVETPYDVEVTLKAKAPSDITDKHYYLDSETTDFKFAKLAKSTCQIDFEQEKITWSQNIYASSYSMNIYYNSIESGVYRNISGISETSIDFNDNRIMTTLNQNAGNFKITIIAKKNPTTIPCYDATDLNTIGYVQSDESIEQEITKLATPTRPIISVDSSDVFQQTTKITWNNITDADSYNVYVSYTTDSIGTLLKYKTRDEGAITTFTTTYFSEIGTYYITVQAVKSGAISSGYSNSATVIRLAPITQASINSESVMTWAPTEIINSGLYDNMYSYYVELLDGNNVSKTIYGVSEPITDATFTITENTWFNELDGLAFKVKFGVLGNATSNNAKNTILLASTLYDVNAYKLVKPVIEISNNEIVISTTDTTVYANGIKIMFSVNSGDDILLAEVEYTGSFAIPASWTNTEFTINAYVTIAIDTELTKNVVKSNTTTINETRLDLAGNVKANATNISNLEQKSVTISWDEVENATSYEIYVNNIYLDATSGLNYITETFTTAGEYTIQIKALSNSKIYSNLTESIKIVRLNPITSAIMNADKEISFTAPTQSVVSNGFYIALVDVSGANKVVKQYTTINSLDVYLGFKENEWLNNYSFGSFEFNMRVRGNGTFDADNKTTILTSDVFEVECYKLESPTLNIYGDYLDMVIINSDFIVQDMPVQTMTNNIFTVVYNENFAKDVNARDIDKYVLNSKFYYPNAWESGAYTITYQSTPKAEYNNVISSNISTKNTTRLETPTNLKFTRETLTNTSNYYSDTTLDGYISTSIYFSFSEVENVLNYSFRNGDFSYFTTDSTINVAGEFETVLNSGPVAQKTLMMQAVAAGNNYISSKTAEISYQTLSKINNFKSRNGILNWNTQLNTNCYVIKVNDDIESVNYWQSESGSDYSTILNGILTNLAQGQIALNIKAIGNITTEGNTDGTIILDSQYLDTAKSFTKITSTNNLRTYLGYLAFDQIFNATNYIAYIYDEDNEFISKTELEDITLALNYTKDVNTVVANSNDLPALTPNTIYNIKIQSYSNLTDTLLSDLSSSIKIKILENANTMQSDIVLKYLSSAELNKTQISAKASINSYGLLIKENTEIKLAYKNAHNEKCSEVTTISMPINVKEGGQFTTFTFASLGSSSIEEGGFYYLSSSYTQSSEIYILAIPNIFINNGIINWEKDDNADGYYVYINNNLYGGKSYNETSLDLPDSFGGLTNTDITIKVIAVTTDPKMLYSPTAYYELTTIIDGSTSNKNIDAMKLKAPDNLDITDGSFIYTDAFNGFAEFNASTYSVIINNMANNPSEETFLAFENYIEKMFSGSVVNFSKYSGFAMGELNLEFINTTSGISYDVAVSAKEFISLSVEQYNILSSIISQARNVINTLYLSHPISDVEFNKTFYNERIRSYISQEEYISYYIYHLYSIFTYAIVDEILSIYNTEEIGYPDMNKLFEELNFMTRIIPAGNYEVKISQLGNKYDWLNSSVSESQDVYIPHAPTSVKIQEMTEGDYMIMWNEVIVPATYGYAPHLSATETSNRTVYILYAEDINGQRYELLRTNGEYSTTQNCYYINLTKLINEGKLTPEMNNIYLVVAGDDNKVINGLQSQRFTITVLPQLAPNMQDGTIYWNSLEAVEKYEITASAQGSAPIIVRQPTTSWIGDELFTGSSYNLTIRALGKIYLDGLNDKNYVLSGKTFNCIINKLESMDVNVSLYGIFNWAEIPNATGYLAYVKELDVTDIVLTLNYESENPGFNTYEFRARGTSGSMLSDTPQIYYLSSHINNDKRGLKGSMLNAVTNVFVENGYIKWTPLTDDNSVAQNEMTLVTGYRLTIDNGIGKIFTTDLGSNVYSYDLSKNRYFDFTEYGNANNYSLELQPYVYFVNNDKTISTNAMILNILDNNEYYQLLGQKALLEFTKIVAPENLKIIDGSIVWDEIINLNNLTTLYYVEVSTASGGVTKVYEETSNIWWSDNENITSNQYYTARIKAYQENCVFSVFTQLANVSNQTIQFKKISTPSLDINTYKDEGTGQNKISFHYEEQGVVVKFAIKYRANDNEEFSYINVNHPNYSNIVDYQNGEVNITVDEIDSQIASMEYYIQIVPIGETELLKSNWSGKNVYSTPDAISEVFLDSENGLFYWAYQGKNFGYIIDDEIYNANNELVAIYHYKIASGDMTNKDYYSTRLLPNNAPSISFMPTVVGYTHKIAVRVSLDPNASHSLSSRATRCELPYTCTLFTSPIDLFVANSTLYDYTSEITASDYLKTNAYGTANNTYKISTVEDFNNINKRLVRYDYTSSYVVEYYRDITDIETKMLVSVDEDTTNYYYTLQNDLTNVETMIGNRVIGQSAIVDYYGFGNTFDGGNFTISYSITAEFTSQKLGLFMQTKQTAIIKNLKVNARINLDAIEKSSQTIGLIVGENYGTITNVQILSVEITNFVNQSLAGLDNLIFGGITGINSGKIEYAIVKASDTLVLSLANSGTYIYAGAIVGKNLTYSEVRNCGNLMPLNVEARNYAVVSGIVGINSGIVLQSYNKATISGKTLNSLCTTNIGGIVGEGNIDGTIEACYATGSIVATNSLSTVYVNAGGIIGSSKNCNIKNCYSSVQTVVIRNTNGDTVYGGTLFGLLENLSTTSNKNYYYNDWAISNKTSLDNLGIKVTITQANLVKALNNDYGENAVFASGNLTPKLIWESIFE